MSTRTSSSYEVRSGMLKGFKRTLILQSIMVALVILLLLPMPTSLAETLYPSIILPNPQLYSMIVKERVLLLYKPLYKAIMSGENYIVDNETGNIAIGNGGYVRIEYPQPRPLVVINVPKGVYNKSSIESLILTMNFTREPSTWSLYINLTGDGKALVYVRGYDGSQGKEYLTETMIMDGELERIEAGYIPGVLYMYVKFSQKSMMFYYTLPDDSLVSSIEFKGSGVFYGNVYSVQPLPRGKKIIIPAWEQTLIGGVTYYITQSSSVYLVLTPFNVEIELIREPTTTEITYAKQLVSAINLPYANGILRAIIKPSLSGVTIGVNASFFNLVDIDKLLDEYYYYVKYFIVELEVYGIIEYNKTKTGYLIGVYDIVLNDTHRKIFISLPRTFNEYSVNVNLKIPGAVVGGDPFDVKKVSIRRDIIISSIVKNVSIAIDQPFILGTINLALFDKRTYCESCFGLNVSVDIDHIVDVDKFIDKYFPYLRHYYLVTTVVVGGEEYSMEKPIEGDNISYELQVPLNNTYNIKFALKAPGMVLGEEDPTKYVEDTIASFTIKLVVPEPNVVIDLPLIVNVVAKRIPGRIAVDIPVKVYWVPGEKVLLMAPTLYKVYLVNPFTGQQELLYSAWSQWLSDADIKVDVPVIMNVHDLVIQVDYFLGGRWVSVTKRVTLNITTPPAPNVTATNITNVTVITPVNVTNVTVTVTNCTFTETLTLTSVIYVANTTITETIANTTIYSTITKTYNITTTTTETKTKILTTTTTKVEVATATFTVTTTTTPELPVLLVSPPYSYGIGAVVAVIVAGISLRYIRGVIGRITTRRRGR